MSAPLSSRWLRMAAASGILAAAMPFVLQLTQSWVPSTSTGGAEFVNSGSPRRPSAAQGEWFEDKTSAKSRITGIEAIESARGQYTPLLRPTDEGVVIESASLDKAVMKNGRVLSAMNIRYSDRIILHVTPVDEPLPVAMKLEQTSKPNTRGETKVYFRTTVCGVAAVARNAGTQKWDPTGDGKNLIVSEYPAILEWVEADASGQLIDYRLVGDLPVEALKSIATAMRVR